MSLLKKLFKIVHISKTKNIKDKKNKEKEKKK
jgi:hypothetical protein